MADNCLLYYPDSPELVNWFTFDDTGQLTSEVTIGSVEQFAEQQGDGKIFVLIPGHHVLLSGVEVPSRKAKQIRAAIPFALEEQLAQDVDDVFFALGAVPKQGTIPIASVSKAYLRDVLETLHNANITPDVVIPDTLCVQNPATDWCVLQTDEHCLVRVSDTQAFSCPISDLTLYMRAALENSDYVLPETLTVIAPDLRDDLRLMLETGGIDITYSSNTSQMGTMFAKSLSEGVPINLLQDEFAAASAWNFDFDWRPWRFAAVFAALIVLTDVGYTFYQNAVLENQRQDLQKSMVLLYKQTFPGAQKIIDPRAQMESKLKSMERSGDTVSAGFLKLLENTAPTIKATANLELNKITYKNGALDYGFSIDSMASMDSLQADLSSGGAVNVSLESAKNERGKITATVRVNQK